MILNTAALDTAVVNGSASNTQSLAAQLAAASSVTASLDVVKGIAASALVAASSTGGITDVIPLSGGAFVSSTLSGMTHQDIPIAGSSVSTVGSSGTVVIQFFLAAGSPGSVLDNSALGADLFGGGAPFSSAVSTATGTALIVFAATGNLSCQSYAIGALHQDIPVADVAGTASVTNVISAGVHLDVPVAATSTAQQTAAGDVNLTKPVAGAVSAASTSSGGLAVTKNMGATALSIAYAAPAVTSVAYVVASNAVASASAVADAHLDKPVAGSSSARSSTVADPKVNYVVAANVSVLFSVTADLHKTDNLADLSGTAAITNVIGADVHLNKPLGGLLSVVPAYTANVVSAHAINLDDMTIGDRTFIVPDAPYATALVDAPIITAEVIDVTYVVANQSIQSWPIAA